MHGGGGSMGGGRAMRSFTQDGSVAHERLGRGTLRRIVGFARPYRGRLTLFVLILALEAAAGAATPLLFQRIIDHGITGGDTRLVVLLAGAAAVLAILAAGLSVADRLVSSQVGEGLILDLRIAVFDHVQRMPLAF